MTRRTAGPQPARESVLTTSARRRPGGDGPLWAAYKDRRTAVTPDGVVRLAVQVRRRRAPGCPRFGAPPRPGQGGRGALPGSEFGPDVIAPVGHLRHAEHRGVPEIHAESARRGVPTCARSVGNSPGRHDELLALSTSGAGRLRRITAEAGRVIPAIDGLRPDVGHEALRAPRDVLGGEVLPARGLLPSCRGDLAPLIGEVKAASPVPIAGVASDGPTSIRNAVEAALDGVPHRLCHLHYLREAAAPVSEAGRHIEARLKKEARGIRPIERTAEGREDAEAGAIRGDCAAVRGALTGGGRPPPGASGSEPQGRLAAVAASPDRGGARGGRRRSRPGRAPSRARARRRPSRCGRTCGRPSAGCIGPRRSCATRRAWTPRGCGGGTGG